MEDANLPDDWRILIDEAVIRHGSEERVLKQDRSRQRSAEILAAALRVFARDGIARARVNDIAAEAGVPPASIYDYFKSKEELAYAVPIQQQTDFYAEFGRQSKNLTSSRERLVHFLWLTTDFARRHPDWARILYLEVWPSVLIKEARVRHVLDDYGRIVVGLLREGARNGEWPEQADPYQTTTILIGSISQLIITWLLYRKPRDLVGASRLLIERLMRLIDLVEPAAAKTPRRRKTGRR
jgi:AcrR family transcriptional regulator